MFRFYFFFLVCAFCYVHEGVMAQNFVNGDLNGSAIGGGQIPTSWQVVPFTDPLSLASSAAQATSDVTDLLGPVASNGIVGNPYSGTTFVSGLLGGQSPTFFWHEGLMQTVNGFTPGCTYKINFFQSVVKQQATDYMDTSGAWSVYFDNTLIGTTASTVSYAPFNSTSFRWDFRSVSFVATAATHTIKFLPADDDPDQNTSNSLGGLRMGIDSIYITSFNVPGVLGSDTGLCQGQSHLLNATIANATYLWHDNSTGPTFNITQAGTYWVRVTTPCGAFSDTINVVYNALPSVSSSQNLTICRGNSAVITAGGGLLYSWLPNAGLSSSTGAVINATPSATTAYTVTVADSNNCTAFAIVNVVVATPSVSIYASSLNVCMGDSAVLSAAGAQQYTWLPASGVSNSTTASTVAYPTALTNYTVIGLDTAGCSDTATVTLNSVIVSADAGPDDTICEGQSAIITGAGGGNYLWSNGSTNALVTVSPLFSSAYTLTVTSGICADVDSVLITIIPRPNVNLGTSLTIVKGNTVTLSANGGTIYDWAPATGLSCTTCSNPVASPTITTQYTVTVYNEYGCVSIDTITVFVVDECESHVFIPTAFSPNDDGQNDFYFLKADCLESFIFKIYNRWGQLIFETNDINIQWDGFYKGKELNTQVLVYTFNAITVNGENIIKSGNISLVR